jgi:hypothetical protein
MMLVALASWVDAPKVSAQTSTDVSAYERAFPQSRAAVEKALKAMQSNLAGHLPALEGFAQPADRALDHYRRAYYQASIQVLSASSGGSLVRVSTKVTAWYNDPAGAHSGYQLLPSNGRLEADLLDQLGEQLAGSAPESNPKTASTAISRAAQAVNPTPASSPSQLANLAQISKPAAPAATDTRVPPAATTPQTQHLFPTTSPQSLEAEARASAHIADSLPKIDKTGSALRAEADSLEEAVKNLSHPKNLVAVKKSGTPVVSAPSLTAKPQFLASLHDEFEMLDFNQDWVHVRVSGLSRGWIWRNSVEMPNGIPETQAASAPPQAAAADLFRVSRDENAPFPGDWEPLRGKSVKILSVQQVDENAKAPGAKERLEYAKFLLDQNYSLLAKPPQELSGIVVIFDSADGGLIAATLATLQQWRAGTLSDSALWHKCFFDPPETFDSAAEAIPGH